MIPRDELRRMYHDEGMMQIEIAEVFNVSSMTISNQIKSYGIHPRTRSESHAISSMKPLKKELEEMYCVRRMSTYKIADEIGVSHATVSNWMQSYRIELRTILESVSGENNWNWKGGVSFEPYCKRFSNKFKESVRERDNYTCQLCGCIQELRGERLSVHHVHYDKENCWPDVVALCRSCNAKVNSNRNYWEEYFELMIIERGLYYWSINDIVA